MPKPLSSSMIAAILGLDPWATPWRPWLRIHGMMPESDHAHWKRGRVLEEHVIPALWRASGGVRLITDPLEFRRGNWMLDHPDFATGGRARATQDGCPQCGGTFSVRSDGRLRRHGCVAPTGEPPLAPRGFQPQAIVEAKTARSFRGWGADGSNSVPPHVAAQCAWHQLVARPSSGDVMVPLLMCSGDSAMVAAVLAAAGRVDELAGGDLRRAWRVYRLPSEDRVLTSVERFAADWYEHHAVGGNPPEIDGSSDCRLHIARTFPEGSGLREPGPEGRALGRDLLKVRQELARLRAEEQRLSNSILAAAGDAAGLVGVARIVRFEKNGRPVRQVNLDKRLEEQ